MSKSKNYLFGCQFFRCIATLVPLWTFKFQTFWVLVWFQYHEIESTLAARMVLVKFISVCDHLVPLVFCWFLVMRHLAWYSFLILEDNQCSSFAFIHLAVNSIELGTFTLLKQEVSFLLSACWLILFTG